MDTLIGVDEIRGSIKCLIMKSNKAPGLDGLPPSIFKLFHNDLITYFTSLFNKVLSSEQYPNSWWCIGSIYVQEGK